MVNFPKLRVFQEDQTLDSTKHHLVEQYQSIHNEIVKEEAINSHIQTFIQNYIYTKHDAILPSIFTDKHRRYINAMIRFYNDHFTPARSFALEEEVSLLFNGIVAQFLYIIRDLLIETEYAVTSLSKFVRLLLAFFPNNYLPDDDNPLVLIDEQYLTDYVTKNSSIGCNCKCSTVFIMMLLDTLGFIGKYIYPLSLPEHTLFALTINKRGIDLSRTILSIDTTARRGNALDINSITTLDNTFVSKIYSTNNEKLFFTISNTLLKPRLITWNMKWLLMNSLDDNDLHTVIYLRYVLNHERHTCYRLYQTIHQEVRSRVDTWLINTNRLDFYCDLFFFWKTQTYELPTQPDDSIFDNVFGLKFCDRYYTQIYIGILKRRLWQGIYRSQCITNGRSASVILPYIHTSNSQKEPHLIAHGYFYKFDMDYVLQIQIYLYK